MNDLILFAGCTLGGAIVGSGIAWGACRTVYGAKLFAMRQDLENARERTLNTAASLKCVALMYEETLESALAAIPPKKPRENGTVAKIRRILEGEQSK